MARKLTIKEIPSALAAHDRAMEASTEIRRELGLEPLNENGIVKEWRARLAEHELKRTSRAHKAPTAAEAREIAKAALALLDLEYPATAADVPDVLESLEVAA